MSSLLRKIIYFFALALVGLIVLFIIGMVFLPMLPIFKDSELNIKITNSTTVPISVAVDIFDMDTNQTYRKQISSMKNISPLSEVRDSVTLDGWTPEGCEKIVITSDKSEKTYHCDMREIDKEKRIYSLEINHKE